MVKKALFAIGSIILSIFLLASSASALTRPTPPSRPIPPPVPEFPEVSGVYSEPSNPLIRVNVFVHREPTATVISPLLVCSLDDPESNSIVSEAGWHLPPNWTYSLNVNSMPQSVGAANLPTIAGNGFTDWVGASNNKVNIARGVNTTTNRSRYDGRNIIAWGRTSNGTLGVTYIRYYVSSGLVVDVDTIMNNRVAWSWSNSNTCADPNAYDAEAILTHELGHWFGMDDEYDGSYQHATMFGYGSLGEVKKNTLSTGDKTGVFSIYNP